MPLFNWIKRRAPASPGPGSNPGKGNAPETASLPEASSSAPAPVDVTPAEQPPPVATQAPATVRATGDDGRIRWRGTHLPVRQGEPALRPLPAPVAPPEPAGERQTEPKTPAAFHPVLEKAATVPEPLPEATAIVPEIISLRLEPILKQLPLELETPEIRALRDGNTRVELPTELVREQLADGRVAIPASIFASGLPEAERPAFAKLAPDARIPIPLQEIFTKLPVSILKQRSDQVEEHPDELIPTPFTVQAQEDAIRFERQRTKMPATQRSEPGFNRADASPPGTSGVAPAGGSSSPVVVADLPEALPNVAKVLTEAIRQAPEALQAIFLRDDVVDLTSALQAVIRLPGVQGAILNNAQGEPLAGYLGHLPGSAPIIQIVTELLHTISQRLRGLPQDHLESVSFHFGDQQITGFVDEMIHLIVIHTARPFRPGVREKIHAFMQELARLSTPTAP